MGNDKVHDSALNDRMHLLHFEGFGFDGKLAIAEAGLKRGFSEYTQKELDTIAEIVRFDHEELKNKSLRALLDLIDRYVAHLKDPKNRWLDFEFKTELTSRSKK